MMYVAKLTPSLIEFFDTEEAMEARVEEFLNNGQEVIRVYELGTAYDVILGALEYIEVV